MPDTAPTITATDLCFAYTGDDVIHHVNIDVNPGRITGIAGPNGCGKSTLIALLAGLLVPRHGTVQRRGPVALVVQQATAPQALPLTAGEVVEMGTWRRRRPRQVVRRLAATALAELGMQDHARKPFSTLSGGQRQRILLAQALAQGAPTLLLDEPAAGLDAASRDRMHEVLRRQAARGTAIAMVSHDADSLQLADRILQLGIGPTGPRTAS